MTIYTPWGVELDPLAVLQEYPRPQLVRDSYLNLNGPWEYAIRPTGEPAPESWDGSIVVPFSPEAPLSGVNRQLQPHETLWYRRAITLPTGFVADRVLLHFGAVDQLCVVRVNSRIVGEHSGGFLPFVLDITEALSGDALELVVQVTDASDTGSHSRGKQKLKRGGIWYTAQSGIWQTVWLESVPANHVERVVLTPQLADGAVDVTVEGPGTGTAVVRIAAPGEHPIQTTVEVNTVVRVPLPTVREWSPEDPFLYDVEVERDSDRVTSYFGMRSFGVGPDSEGTPRLLLNGRPYYHAGLLDQGYWSDGYLTPPSDEAMIFDIELAKSLGFTMLRKHIKVEPLRWYYHCDRLGMLVWQDMVNGGSSYHPLIVTAPVLSPVRVDDRHHGLFSRRDAVARQTYQRELTEMVELLRSVVSIAVWVPFNEGWGQFDAAQTAADLKLLDPTRSVDHASGWHDQGGGDFASLHVYFRKFRMPSVRSRAGRVLAVTEYGGYSLRIPGHSFNEVEFGYRKYRSALELDAAFVELHEQQLLPAVARGLSATVYTQLSDVEDELNGLVTYDRRVVKLTADVVRSVNDALCRVGGAGTVVATGAAHKEDAQ